MKRFTESSKWTNLWFSELPSKWKLAWLCVLDNCNHSGIIDANAKALSFWVGEPIDSDEFLRMMNGRVKVINESKWFIEPFIKFQYGDCLSQKNSAHRGVLKLLEIAGIECPVKVEDSPYEAPTKGLPRGYLAPKDKDKDKDKEQNTDKQPEKLPFHSPAFSEAWNTFKKHRSEIRKPLKPTSSAMQLKQLEQMGEARAIAAIRHTVAKGWQGLQEPNQGQIPYQSQLIQPAARIGKDV